MTVVILLGLFALAFGVKALRGLAIIGFLGFGAFMVYEVNDLTTMPAHMSANSLWCRSSGHTKGPECPHGEPLGPHPVTIPCPGTNSSWIAPSGTPPSTPCPLLKEMQRAQPAAQTLPPPAPVATAPASPASSWELLPWPPDAPDTQTPSPAAQRLLDRLNGWAK